MGILPPAHCRWSNRVSLLPFFSRSQFPHLHSGDQFCPAYELKVSEWIHQREDVCESSLQRVQKVYSVPGTKGQVS